MAMRTITSPRITSSDTRRSRALATVDDIGCLPAGQYKSGSARERSNHRYLNEAGPAACAFDARRAKAVPFVAAPRAIVVFRYTERDLSRAFRGGPVDERRHQGIGGARS